MRTVWGRRGVEKNRHKKGSCLRHSIKNILRNKVEISQ